MDYCTLLPCKASAHRTVSTICCGHSCSVAATVPTEAGWLWLQSRGKQCQAGLQCWAGPPVRRSGPILCPQAVPCLSRCAAATMTRITISKLPLAPVLTPCNLGCLSQLVLLAHKDKSNIFDQQTGRLLLSVHTHCSCELRKANH